MATKTARTEAASYSEDELPEFSPMPWMLSEIRSAIPAHLHVRRTWKGLLYLVRDVTMAFGFWRSALYIDSSFTDHQIVYVLTPMGAKLACYVAWMVYWWFQGLTFTGIWVIGHECGHWAFSSNKFLCDAIGYTLHTFLLTPYFSWQISHHRHHSNHASMERDEVYVPHTRSELGIPMDDTNKIDWGEYFGDTPIYTICMLLRQQFLGFLGYLLYNASGQPKYPKFTNHFNPNAVLFSKKQRNVVFLSDVGIAAMIWAISLSVSRWGTAAVIKLYIIPWVLVTHWFIMITYLHHTDVGVPHYRNKEWNFQRGAAATIDRDFLGWQGRFFLHDVAHFHVVHHFFPMMPFYNGSEATKYLEAFIGEHYRHSTKPVFHALWESYNHCQFVDDAGDIVFYRDRKGQARCRPSAMYRVPDATVSPS